MFAKLIIRLLAMSLAIAPPSFAKLCTGHFVNPIKDICWKCLFPLSIGNMPVVSGPKLDTLKDMGPLLDTLNSSAARHGRPKAKARSPR